MATMTAKVNPVAFMAGKISGETEKAYKVEMPMERNDGAERDFSMYFPKSRSENRDGQCWVTAANFWLISKKYEELEARIDAYRAPLGITAQLEDGSVEVVF